VMTNTYDRQKAEGFAPFMNKIKGKKITLVYDKTTRPFANQLIGEMGERPEEIGMIYFPKTSLVPDEQSCKMVIDNAKDAEYLLAIGSGPLCDVCKNAATKLGIPSGVMVTAANMDDDISGKASLMENGKKVIKTVNMPEDVLVDNIILMIFSGDVPTPGSKP